MSFPRCIPVLAFGLAATASFAGAQSAAALPAGSRPARTEPILSAQIHAEITRLARQAAGITAVVSASSEPPAGTKPDEDEIVVLAPMTVTDKIPPDLNPPRETRAEKFFRTGTIAEHVGRKVTTRFWISGGQGLMLSFDF